MRTDGQPGTRGVALRGALLLIVAGWLGGCAAPPPFQREDPLAAPPAMLPDATGVAIARAAQSLVGSPYRYGGAGPDAFDCSGLVMYSYRQAGLALPHSTDKQRATSRPVKVAELRRGDLLFFNQEGKKHGHVGIYVGGGKFVHAPSSGKSVRSDRLDSPYWKKHLTEARRI